MLERYISDFIASFEFEKGLLLYQSNDVFFSHLEWFLLIGDYCELFFNPFLYFFEEIMTFRLKV